MRRPRITIYIFYKHRTGDDDVVFLFDGKDPNKRYYLQLTTAVNKEIDSTIDLGLARVDIGIHSCRKFAEFTYVSKIDGPCCTQVCFRAYMTQDCIYVHGGGW